MLSATIRTVYPTVGGLCNFWILRSNWERPFVNCARVKPRYRDKRSTTSAVVYIYGRNERLTDYRTDSLLKLNTGDSYHRNENAHLENATTTSMKVKASTRLISAELILSLLGWALDEIAAFHKNLRLINVR
jgi:hypothetical protein